MAWVFHNPKTGETTSVETASGDIDARKQAAEQLGIPFDEVGIGLPPPEPDQFQPS